MSNETKIERLERTVDGRLIELRALVYDEENISMDLFMSCLRAAWSLGVKDAIQNYELVKDITESTGYKMPQKLSK